MDILSRIFGQPLPASRDSVTFDASRYDFQGDQDEARVWYLPGSGGVGLYFFPFEPGLPLHATSVGQLRDCITAAKGKSKVVECRVVPLDGVQSVRVIAKELDEQKRATYVGSLLIPFRDFSFVIKIQCSEQGFTGWREAVVLAEAFRNSTARIGEDGRLLVPPGGLPFDDEKFDDILPEHPLSRVRRELRHMASSVQIQPIVKGEARFELPQNDT
jgi:hypothetical protein